MLCHAGGDDGRVTSAGLTNRNIYQVISVTQASSFHVRQKAEQSLITDKIWGFKDLRFRVLGSNVLSFKVLGV